MPKQRHDIGRRKWEASAEARRQAELRRARRRRLVRRRKLRDARAAAADSGQIQSWREARRKSGERT